LFYGSEELIGTFPSTLSTATPIDRFVNIYQTVFPAIDCLRSSAKPSPFKPNPICQSERFSAFEPQVQEENRREVS
jgi:hypothetical protein